VFVLDVQVYTRWHVHMDHPEPLMFGSSTEHNSTQQQDSSSSSSMSKLQQQQQQQQQQQPAVNSLQLTVIQVADGSWHLQDTDSSSRSGVEKLGSLQVDHFQQPLHQQQQQQQAREPRQEQIMQLAEQGSSSFQASPSISSSSQATGGLAQNDRSSSANDGTEHSSTAAEPRTVPRTAARIPKVITFCQLLVVAAC
jgi:hypothetical protein